MGTSKLEAIVRNEPYGQLERDGRVVFEGFVSMPEQLNADCQFLYSIVDKAHVNEATPHIHEFPIIMSFFGADHTNIKDFDAEIWFYLGGERHVITTTTTISVPPGLAHCPLIFKRVTKPLVFVEVMLTGNYERREVDIPLNPDPGI